METAEWFEIKHESFMDDSKAHLVELRAFLGVNASAKYLEDCAAVVFNAPHRSRFEAAWNGSLIDEVDQRIRCFPFLQGYSYDG